MTLCGGYGASKEGSDERLDAALAQVKEEAQSKAGKDLGPFQVHSYQSQVVAGTNYKVKVHIGDEEYAHLDIHQPLPHTGDKAQLKNVQVGKSVSDSL